MRGARGERLRRPLRARRRRASACSPSPIGAIVRDATPFTKDDERDLTLRRVRRLRRSAARGRAPTCSRALPRDGVAVKILTGDNDAGRAARLRASRPRGRRPCSGDEIERLTDPALAQRRRAHRRLRRVSPAQKNRIILALKRARARRRLPRRRHQRRAVAARGRRRHLGRQARSTSPRGRRHHPARARASTCCTQGIVEGRRAFGNVMKYLLMGTSSNFGNMFSMAGASLFLPFLPMLPTQILLNNFLYDLAQITIPTDNVDRRATSARPQRWDMRLRAPTSCSSIGPISSLFDFLTFFVLLAVLPRVADDAVSHRLVRRVARDADARALRHPHDGQSAAAAGRARAHRYDDCHRRRRRVPAVHADRHLARLRADARLFPLRRARHGGVPCARRGREAQRHESGFRMRGWAALTDQR